MNEENKTMIYFPEKDGEKRGRYTKEQKKLYELNKRKLVDILRKLDKDLEYKLSARGWCYIAEGLGIVHKGQFDKIVEVINECRDEGLLPIDFTAHDISREFENIEPFIIKTKTPEKYLIDKLKELKKVHTWKNDIAFWEVQSYYLMMVVEKIDLKTIFAPICKYFHIPIANAKGSSSMNMRYFITKKLKFAEQLGKTPVLLYYGDFDPWGVKKIAEGFPNLIRKIEKASNLHIKNMRFDHVGLSYEFIQKNNLPWIDNLISGNGKKPNYKDPDIRKWIEKYGERKVEANAIVLRRDEAMNDLYHKILEYLDEDSVDKYQEKIANEQGKIKAILEFETIGFYKYIDSLIEELKKNKFTFEGEENNE